MANMWFWPSSSRHPEELDAIEDGEDVPPAQQPAVPIITDHFQKASGA